ncbi:MAG: Glu/Leu/Phe/Val dehydrogenase [Bacteroidetes bacterium]|nr:Glu/Leu/Phe/Val dehydrogenase [Bacteroidota bacterium]
MLSVKQAVSSEETSGVFAQIAETNHEQVVFCNDPDTGLKSIIAIHDTTIGPALGGTRMWNYGNENEALNDVLRLSRGMTYKAALSGINLGGGKAVVIGDSKTDKTEALWRRYGKFVDSLNGKYITAEDVGTSTRDMEYIAMETKWVTGVPEYMGGSGDPSPVTAYGTYLGMKACGKEVWGNDRLEGKKVLVQGVGHVGEFLVDHLSKEGAKIFISDIDNTKLKDITKKYKDITVVDKDEVYDIDMDIYAPCALGATLNDDTISRLKCSIIAGGANNQLADENIHAQLLKDKGILYAPDFLINAGGVINVYFELEGYNRDRAYGTTELIYDRTLKIIQDTKNNDITTHEAALKAAEKRIEEIAKIKSKR